MSFAVNNTSAHSTSHQRSDRRRLAKLLEDPQIHFFLGSCCLLCSPASGNGVCRAEHPIAHKRAGPQKQHIQEDLVQLVAPRSPFLFKCLTKAALCQLDVTEHGNGMCEVLVACLSYLASLIINLDSQGNFPYLEAVVEILFLLNLTEMCKFL